MDLKLTGKVALVTGSSRGIGLSTAKVFAAEGCRLMLSARSAGHLGEAEVGLRTSGAEVAAHAADVSNPDEAAELVEATARAYGGIDILVNNVGGGGGGARLQFQHRHFAEHLPRPDLRQRPAGFRRDLDGDFHAALLHDVNAVAGVALAENFAAGRERAFAGDLAQGGKIARFQMTERLAGIKRDHAGTLGEKSSG